MRFKTVGNKVDKAFIVIHNPSSTTTIPIGAPCYFTMSSTGILGVDVQNCNAAAGIDQGFFAGVVAESTQQGIGGSGLGPGMYGEAQIWGFVQSLRLIRQTRATSTDVWASVASTLGIGDILVPQTNTIGANSQSYDAWSDVGTTTPFTFSLGSAASTTATNSGFVNMVGASNPGQYAILAQSLASLASSASSNFGTGTGSTVFMNTVLVNAFICAL